MNEQLQQAIEEAQQLPIHTQDAIAARIWRVIEEQEWKAIVSQPHVQQHLHELGRQALGEKRETEEDGLLIKSKRTKGFEKLFARIPAQVQQEARDAWTLFRDGSPSSLQFRCIHQRDPIYSIRISKSYRAVGWYEDGVVRWFWIGSYEDYNHIGQVPDQRGGSDERATETRS